MHALERLRVGRCERSLLTRAKLSRQLDDAVLDRVMAQRVELGQNLRGQRTRASTKFPDARRERRQPPHELRGHAGTEERGELRCRDKVAGSTEFTATARVIAHPRLVQCDRHVAVKADGSARAHDCLAHTRFDLLRDLALGGVGIGQGRLGVRHGHVADYPPPGIARLIPSHRPPGRCASARMLYTAVARALRVVVHRGRALSRAGARLESPGVRPLTLPLDALS